MIRTRAAKKEAGRLGIYLAELLRRSLRIVLRVDESKPWMRYAGMVETGDPRSSQIVPIHTRRRLFADPLAW